MQGTRWKDTQESFRPPRSIVVCFDGTSGQYNSMNTNVVKFFGLLRKDCPDQQVTYYQAGIGTYFAPGVVSPLWTRLASLLDEGVAWYLDAHVMEGYKFLMANYRTGDKICIFGFSRGAYTARALAGMLRKIGLLPKDNIQQISFAYKAYKRTDKEGVKLAAGFKQTFTQDVKIDFLGVWDTVQSTGVLISRTLPFTQDNDGIRVFRHALSLDEHRSRFRPNLYHWPAQDNDPNASAAVEGKTGGMFQAVMSTIQQLFTFKKPTVQLARSAASNGTPANGESSNGTQTNGEFVAEELTPGTDVLEVWFAGGHSDVGGGNVKDDVEVSLAQIPLHWMVEHVMQAQCGVLFDNDALARIGFSAWPFSNQPTVNDEVSPVSKTTQGSALPNQANQFSSRSETSPERLDAVAPLFDELVINKLWWVLEVLPCTEAWQDDNGVWNVRSSINMGRGRFIPYQKPKFHHTVKQRMDDKSLKYKPRATYDNDAIYV